MGILAHTDIVQPSGTSACRGSSNGDWARSPGTLTDVDTNFADAGAGAAGGVGDAGDGCGGESVEHPASRAMPSSPAVEPVTRRQIRMHLPDENLGRLGRGDALAARRGEPDGVTFVKRSGAFERHLAARDEQVQERRFRQLDGVSRLQPCAVQRRASCCGW